MNRPFYLERGAGKRIEYLFPRSRRIEYAILWRQFNFHSFMQGRVGQHGTLPSLWLAVRATFHPLFLSVLVTRERREFESSPELGPDVLDNQLYGDPSCSGEWF